MKLLAIDPGSNRCGIAIFEDSKLTSTLTLNTDRKTPLERRLSIMSVLVNFMEDVEVFVCEEPFLQGKANNGMQRLLGYIELCTDGNVHFIHPMTLKSRMGSGTLDKFHVALAAGALLKTEEEQELIAELIEKEAWDETDAIAVGLSYLKEH